MVTMAEIDAARSKAGEIMDTLRSCTSPTSCSDCANCTTRLNESRMEVERLLREWWDQECREEEQPWGGVGKQRYAELLATEVRTAIRSEIDRAREACAGNRSPGNDWIDELIGLLRVTRGQRDDARMEAIRAERERKAFEQINNDLHKEIDRLRKLVESETIRANDLEQAAAEAQKIARANKVRLEDSIERAERAEAECNRLATAIREALKILRAPSGHLDVAEEILSFAVSAHGGDEKFKDCKSPYFPKASALSSLEGQPQDLPRDVEPIQIATIAWVEAKIDEKIKAYANAPNSVFVGHIRCK